MINKTFNSFNSKKSLGQHFLIDEIVIYKIISAIADLPKQTIIEIGPGNLALTKNLVKAAKYVLAIEKDSRLQNQLEHLKTQANNFNYVIADALSYVDNILESKILVSNLPYNVGTQIFLNYLHSATSKHFNYFILMFQKEVAERIVAQPSSPAYGRLSIISQLLSQVEILFTVDKHSFKPMPKVQSAVIKVTPLATPRFDVDIKQLSTVTKLAFQGKRKTIRNSLKGLKLNLAELNLNLNKRAEELSIEDFCNITNLLKQNDCNLNKNTTN